MNSIFTNALPGENEDEHIYTLKELFNQNKKENDNNIINEEKNKDNNKDNKNNLEKQEDLQPNEISDEIKIKEIKSKIQKQKNPKKSIRIQINLDNNIIIGYIPQNLITEFAIVKDSTELLDKTSPLNHSFSLYEKIMKESPIPYSSIKKYDKNEIKIDNNYIYKENLEEKDIIPALYNENEEEIKNLEKSLEKSIDKSFDRSYEKSFDKSLNNMSLNQSDSQNLNHSNSLSYNDASFNASRNSIEGLSGKGIIEKLTRMFSGGSMSINKEIEEENNDDNDSNKNDKNEEKEKEEKVKEEKEEMANEEKEKSDDENQENNSLSEDKNKEEKEKENNLIDATNGINTNTDNNTENNINNEKYLFKEKPKDKYYITRESESRWSPKTPFLGFMNSPSTEYNILNPSKKNTIGYTRDKITTEINEYKKKIIEEKKVDRKISKSVNYMNPIYRQKGIVQILKKIARHKNYDDLMNDVILENKSREKKNNEISDIIGKELIRKIIFLLYKMKKGLEKSEYIYVFKIYELE